MKTPQQVREDIAKLPAEEQSEAWYYLLVAPLLLALTGQKRRKR